MTPQQFRDIINQRLMPHLPDLKAYMATVPQDTRDAWAAQFEGIEPCDLIEAIRGVIMGDLNIAAYERERTATILLRESRRVRDVRMNAERAELRRRELLEQARTGGDRPTVADRLAERLMQYGCGPALKEIEQRVSAGEDRETIVAEVCAEVRAGRR